MTAGTGATGAVAGAVAGEVAGDGTSVDTHLPGSPASVERLADALARDVLTVLDDAVTACVTARAAVAGEWHGMTAERVEQVLTELARAAEAAERAVESVVVALRDYAARLRWVQGRLADLRDDARAEGLRVEGTLITLVPGRECAMAQVVEQAQDLFAEAFRAAVDVGRAGHGLAVLGGLLLVPGAVFAARQGQWTARSRRLRAGAGIVSPAAADPAIDRASDLERRARTLGRGGDAALFPLGVWLDHESGEPWDQAVASNGAGALAAGLAGAGVGFVVGTPAGPGAVGVALGGFFAGALVGGIANGQVDRLYERHREREERLRQGCRPAGSAGGRGATGRRTPVFVKTGVVD